MVNRLLLMFLVGRPVEQDDFLFDYSGELRKSKVTTLKKLKELIFANALTEKDEI